MPFAPTLTTEGGASSIPCPRPCYSCMQRPAKLSQPGLAAPPHDCYIALLLRLCVCVSGLVRGVGECGVWVDVSVSATGSWAKGGGWRAASKCRPGDARPQKSTKPRLEQVLASSWCGIDGVIAACVRDAVEGDKDGGGLGGGRRRTCLGWGGRRLDALGSNDPSPSPRLRLPTLPRPCCMCCGGACGIRLGDMLVKTQREGRQAAQHHHHHLASDLRRPRLDTA